MICSGGGGPRAFAEYEPGGSRPSLIPLTCPVCGKADPSWDQTRLVVPRHPTPETDGRRR